MSRPDVWRRRRAWLFGSFATVALTGFVLAYPVTTRQGVNFELSTHRIPLYLKVIEFVDRSAQYRQIAQEIVAGLESDEERALAVFEWTTRHIRPVPDGWPIVDDHILNIIIRGYGMPDQQADVFATLTTYADVPAFWRTLRQPDGKKGLVLTFVRIGDRLRVFDARRGIAFRNAHGSLATLDEITGDPELVPASVRDVDVGGARYADVVTHLVTPSMPRTLRADLQMPSRRLLYELRTALGIETPHEPD